MPALINSHYIKRKPVALKHFQATQTKTLSFLAVNNTYFILQDIDFSTSAEN